MRAAELDADGEIQVVALPDPEPALGEVVVEVALCGVCGSDLHAYHDRSYFRHGSPAGIVFGHELSGTVAAVGAGVEYLAVGERVAVMPAWHCGRCDACRRGESVLLCDEGTRNWIGLGDRSGGMAGYCAVPAAACYPLAPSMSFQRGALVEPYCVALRARERSRVARRDALAGVGVLGAGPVGLMMVAALRAAGIEDVRVGEPREPRRVAAAALGAAAAPTIEEASAGAPPPEIVFDCTGIVRGPEAAGYSTRPGGQVVVVGVPSGDFVIAPRAFVLREVDFVSSIAYTARDFEQALAELTDPSWGDPDVMISASVPLAQTRDAFHRLVQPDGPVKILIDPWS